MPKTKETPLWWPMFALPNIDIAFPIQVDGFALTRVEDFRVKSIAKKQIRFASYLKKFKNEFGDAKQPSLIIWRKDKPNTYRTISAISGFRDLVSMSVIPYAWARTLRWQRTVAPMYSDAFSIYPWMVDNKGEHLITRTPTMFGIHEVKLLRAQGTPALSQLILKEDDVDQLLLPELLKRWESCFATENPTPEDERLFRSLNMANAAAMMPAGADAKLYDTVRSVALWASAFEILRPAKNQAYKKIYADLDSIEWNNTACKQRMYAVFGEPADTLHTLPVWLFGEINRLRNDTLHGNPLPPGRLIVPPGKQAISMYAAPLYRMMLIAFLKLKLAPRKPVGGMTKYEAHRMDMYESGKYQRDIEVALATVLKSDEEQDEARRIRPRRSAGPP
jgi:hypothetical protein